MMVSPIIAPARPRSVSNNRARSGANQPARNGSAGGAASQTADKRAGAGADQCAAQNAILPAARAPLKTNWLSSPIAHGHMIKTVSFQK
jgi:hypothetical protein